MIFLKSMVILSHLFFGLSSFGKGALKIIYSNYFKTLTNVTCDDNDKQCMHKKMCATKQSHLIFKDVSSIFGDTHTKVGSAGISDDQAQGYFKELVKLGIKTILVDFSELKEKDVSYKCVGKIYISNGENKEKHCFSKKSSRDSPTVDWAVDETDPYNKVVNVNVKYYTQNSYFELYQFTHTTGETTKRVIKESYKNSADKVLAKRMSNVRVNGEAKLFIKNKTISKCALLSVQEIADEEIGL